MPLKQFNVDYAAAASKVAARLFDNIIALRKGESDGELSITYQHDNLTTPLRIQLLIPDISEYPGRASFLIFTENEDIPATLPSALAHLQDQSTGLDISAMISTLGQSLTRHLERTDLDTADGEIDEVESDDDYNYESDVYDYDDDPEELFGTSTANRAAASEAVNEDLHPRLKQDLKTVKGQGYKVGILLSSPLNNIISISVRASRLRLPEATLEIWDIRPEEYLVLLIRQMGSYTALEDIACSQSGSQARVELRFGKCSHHKPTYQEALKAFSSPANDDPSALKAGNAAKFRKIFISNSLDQFLDQGFLVLVKIREAKQISWDQANEVFLRLQMRTDQLDEKATDAKFNSDPAFDGSTVPRRFRHDHLRDDKDSLRSWPLVAMQFAMRYFLACTKYCLRCHRIVDGDYETLKPYVCSDPLCLFQYLSMGLGPSTEHEIRSQPKVVDLLVSFCYSSLSTDGMKRCAIREFPVGLHLKIPDLSEKPSKNAMPGTVSVDGRQFRVQGDLDLDRICPQQWVALRLRSLANGENGVSTQATTGLGVIPVCPTQRWVAGDLVHCQIESIEYSSQTIALSHAIVTGPWPKSREEVYKNSQGQAYLLPYEHDFDCLDVGAKSFMMAHLLETLPRISEIKNFLEENPISKVRDMPGIPAAASSLLAWIIASNRSCIFETSDAKLVDDSKGSPSTEETIPDMQGWAQFRFLQGSPDKESRFQTARELVKCRKNLACPSIFAWHGSSLQNWHSIVRTGLDYTETRNGRAYGHGVYFSPDFNVSSGYTFGVAQTSFGVWPNSDLRIAGAISLNEIVNSPDEFVSKAPHLVVAQPDWHMCRFLFVRNDQGSKAKAMAQAIAGPIKSGHVHANSGSQPNNHTSGPFLEQDTSMTPRGPSGLPLRIPLAALPSYHYKKSKTDREVIYISEDSSDEHDSDAELLGSGDEEIRPPSAAPKPSASSTPPLSTIMTDFRPGTLDLKSLPRLQPPSWAASRGLKNITLEIKQLQALQRQTPLQELGWYIDFEQLDNMFQWIVELHSFDPALPLAADLKKAGITSVVCEIRFGEQFPYTPPFVRVIRPRFMPFLQGGGGHVTAGGAMCMELLTNSGWSPVSTIESVLLQVRMAMSSTDPKPARLDRTVMAGAPSDYGISEAVDAYIRAATAHGWQVPSDIRQMMTGFSYAGPGA